MEYKTKGVCSMAIQYDIDDEQKVHNAKFKLDIARSFGIMSDEEAVNFQKQRRMLNENNWYYWRNGS